MRFRSFFILSAISYFCLCSSTVVADELLQIRPNEVTRHEKRRSSYRFNNRNKADSNLAGFLFSTKPWEKGLGKNASLVDQTQLPRCTRSEVKRRKVFHHSPGSEAFDVLYFSETNRRDKDRAVAYKSRAIAYQPEIHRDPETSEVDRWQVFARFVQIPCLPARFHFVYEGKQRFIEYRLGDRAWDQ